MSKRAKLGKMSLCYVTTNRNDIGNTIGNSKAKIVCINDAKVIDDNEDEDCSEKYGKKQDIYNQLQDILTTVYNEKSIFERI